jgi:hypothetical protein
LTFSGIFGPVAAPVEEWSFRINFGVGEGGGDKAAFVQNAVSAFTTHLVPRLASGVGRLREVKLADIDAAGLYSTSPTVAPVDVAFAGSVSSNLPLQISCAVSLVTQRRGPTGKGRFYLPSPALGTLTAAGLMTASTAQAIATSAAAFMSALNGPAGFGNAVVVSTKGYDTVVEGVRVGVVPDTIRSRREKLLEGYGATLAVAL